MKIKVSDTIVMRKLTLDDAREVYAMIDKNRGHFDVWLPGVNDTNSKEKAEANIAKWEDEAKNRKSFILGIFKDGRYVGNIDLHDFYEEAKSASMGYWISEDAQGNGIVTGCARALISYAFDEMGLNRIRIYCATPNKKSRAIPERLGFVQEGVLREDYSIKGKIFDLAVYGMLKREWKGGL